MGQSNAMTVNLVKGLTKSTTTTPAKTGLEQCGCGRPAILRRVSKPGPNFGRYFYGCPKFATDEDDTKCGYFRWEENPPQPKTRPAKIVTTTTSAMKNKKHQRNVERSDDDDDNDDIVVLPVKKTRFAEPTTTITTRQVVQFDRAADADYSTTGESSGVYSFTTDNEDDCVFWLDQNDRRSAFGRNESAISDESGSTFQDASDGNAGDVGDVGDVGDAAYLDSDPTVPSGPYSNRASSSLNRADAERGGHEDSSRGDFVVPTHPSDVSTTPLQPPRAANARTRLVSPHSPRSPHSPHTPHTPHTPYTPSASATIAYPSPSGGTTGPSPTGAGATAPPESPEPEPPLTNAEVIQIVSNQFARHERLMAGAQRSHSGAQTKYERLRQDFEELKRKNELLDRENGVLHRENELLKAEKRLLKRELSNMRDEIEMLAAERNRAETDGRR